MATQRKNLAISTVALLCLAFLLYACGNKNLLKITERNFDTEIALQQNISFQFNKNLCPDSLLQAWDTSNYLDISPKVDGSYRWTNSNELVFSPNKGFAPNTTYTVKLNSEILKHSNDKIDISKENITFSTPSLKVIQSNSQWNRSSVDNNVMTQMNLTFNYDVNLQEAASKLKIESQGKNIAFNNITTGVGKTLSVQFLPITESDEDSEVNVSLTKGIAISGAENASKYDTAFTATVHSRYSLSISSINAHHEGSEGVIAIYTSQPILEEGQMKKHFKIEPAVNYDMEFTEQGITIISKEFTTDKNYTITIKKEIEGAFGGKLKADFTEMVYFGELTPSIKFANTKGIYLSSKGYKNLALNLVNVANVNVTVVKVYENNILQLLNKGNRWSYDYDYESDEYYEYQYFDTYNLGDTVFNKSYQTKNLPKNNAVSILNLDFSDRLKDYNGLYVITVSNDEQRWLRSSKMLSLSDIGLIVKSEENKMYVFANSIKNATPISGAKISFVSTNNQQVHTLTTNSEGVAVFDDLKNKAKGFNIGMVTAKAGDDFNFIWLPQNRIETSRFDVGGRSANSTGLNAWLYAERNLYRPGETIKTSAVVRNEDRSVPNEMPLKFKLTMPNGKTFGTKRKITNEQGSCETEFDIPHTAITGNYTLELLTGNDVVLQYYNFSIEDFMPDRIKNVLKLNQEKYKIDDELIASVQADNLFGTPAINRNYEIEFNLRKKSFSPKGYDDYNFYINKNFYYGSVFRNGKTDDKGSITEKLQLDDERLAAAGLLQGSVRATVFDENGRPVHRFANFDVITQNVFYGIKYFNSYVGTRAPLNITFAALDPNGVPVHKSAQVNVIRKEWQNVIQQSGNSYRYVSQWTEKTVVSKKINIDKNGTNFTFTPTLSGSYEVRISDGENDNYVSETFYAYGGGDTDLTSFEVNNEGNVTIKIDKEKYTPGEHANILFTTPFEGRMLVTVERDKVLEYHLLNTKDKSATLKLPIGKEHLPNIYISATLFRAMEASDLPLTVAHGIKNIPVNAAQNNIPVDVAVASNSRSKTKQKITVKTQPNAFVTIAAVDEGILQIKDYKSPDPFKYFYQKMALGVNSFDIYPLLLPEYKTTRSSTGGDGADDEMANRVNPIFVNRVKNVSFWSGIKKADGNGNVTYEIEVPEFSGQLRVMAVAYKDDGFGCFDSHVTVADPIIISSGLPRFLSPGDVAKMPVTLSNTTNKDAQATVKVSTNNMLSVENASTKTINIKAKSEARLVFDIAATNAIGAGKVTVSVNALKEKFTNETELAVRPPASIQKQFESGVVKAGSNKNISGSTSNFLDNTVSGYLLVSNSPLVQFSKSLDYLVQYPHGCLEQTISTAFPQMYFGDLVKALQSRTNYTAAPSYNVQQAILKIQSMQFYNGSLSYWPGGNYESWWGSVYAAHFLTEAKNAGFEVDDKILNKLYEYLRTRLKKKETIDYYLQGQANSKKIAAKEIPYTLYVLALAKKPEHSFMNYYKGNVEMLSLDGQYLLSAAFMLSGQKEKALQVLPPKFEGEKSESVFGGSFYSYIRDKAISLNALLDTDPNSSQVAELSKQLSEDLLTQPYLNTQERSFGFLALGKIARKAASTKATAAITGKGKTLGTSNGEPLKIDLKNNLGANADLQLKVSGTGNFYYFKEVSGISADGSIVEEDKYMSVRRTFYTKEGKPITDFNFKQNDLIVVKISIQGQYKSAIENVVITDMLPAGFEIENTRLNQMGQMKWVENAQNAYTPDYTDVRDDRINLFTTVTSNARSFYYMVRAVSPGTYKLGPVQADAMYNGMYHSYHGASTVRISE